MMQQKPRLHSMTMTDRRTVDGIDHHDVVVPDIFAKKRFVLERALVHSFTSFLEWYLKRHPSMEFNDPRNLARKLTYIPGGMRAWAQYMPGGYATFYTSEPHHRKLRNGARLDGITRSFFRHTYDAVGLRSRSAVLAALSMRYVTEHDSQAINWVSIAAGAGQHVVPILQGLPPNMRNLVSWTLIDVDPNMRDFAEEIYTISELRVAKAEFLVGDIFDKSMQHQIGLLRPHVVDAMGLFDYLDDAKITELVSSLYDQLPQGSILVFSNMNNTRPHLNVHQRAVGWPGVIPKSAAHMAKLISAAGVEPSRITTYCPQDKVYTVYRVEKT